MKSRQAPRRSFSHRGPIRPRKSRIVGASRRIQYRSGSSASPASPHAASRPSVRQPARRNASVAAHRLLGLPEHEVIAAMVCVGEAPEQVEVAASPRRSLEEVLTWH